MKPILLSLGVAALVGCTGVKPVGVLSKETPMTQQSRPLSEAPADAARPPSIRPTPPTALVAPDDVDPNVPSTVYAAASKLAAEVDADGKTGGNMPVTVEVSRVKAK